MPALYLLANVMNTFPLAYLFSLLWLYTTAMTRLCLETSVSNQFYAGKANVCLVGLHINSRILIVIYFHEASGTNAG